MGMTTSLGGGIFYCAAIEQNIVEPCRRAQLESAWSSFRFSPMNFIDFMTVFVPSRGFPLIIFNFKWFQEREKPLDQSYILDCDRS